MVFTPHRINTLVVFICFLFIFCPFAWADTVLLKNGNTLEGKILREDSDTVLLEVYMESGSSRTIISKSKIKAIEHSEISELPRQKKTQAHSNPNIQLSEKEMEEQLKKLKAAIVIIACVFFAFLSLPYFLLNLISKIRLEKPFGFKIICLWMSYVTMFLLLAAAVNIVLGRQGITFDVKSGNLFVFLLVNIGIPLSMFTLLIGLVYLRRWGRILLIVLLILGITAQAAELAFKKDIIGAPLGVSLQKIPKEYNVFLQQKLQAIPIKWYTITFFVFMLLYLNRKRVSDAFSQASEHKLSQIIGKTRLIIAVLIIAALFFALDKSYKPLLQKLTDNPYFLTLQEALKNAALKQSSSGIALPLRGSQ